MSITKTPPHGPMACAGAFIRVRHAGADEGRRAGLCEKPGASLSADETWSDICGNSRCRAAVAQASPPGTNRARPERAAERQVWIRAMSMRPFSTIGGVMDGNDFVFILARKSVWVSALLHIHIA